MRGINSILEQEKRAITLLADNLKKLEKILIQIEDNSKIDIITELSKDITIIGDYLKNHFVYNLSLDNEDVNHCCRFACSDSKFVDGYGNHPFKSECKNHSHEELVGDCQYCNLIPHAFEEFRDLLAYSNSNDWVYGRNWLVHSSSISYWTKIADHDAHFFNISKKNIGWHFSGKIIQKNYFFIYRLFQWWYQIMDDSFHSI